MEYNNAQGGDYITNGDNNYFVDLGNLKKNIKNNFKQMEENNSNISLRRNKILKPINAYNK